MTNIVTDQQTTPDVANDPELREIVDSAEAGIADLIAVYEQAETRYLAAASQLAPASTVAYATHT